MFCVEWAGWKQDQNSPQEALAEQLKYVIQSPPNKPQLQNLVKQSIFTKLIYIPT